MAKAKKAARKPATKSRAKRASATTKAARKTAPAMRKHAMASGVSKAQFNGLVKKVDAVNTRVSKLDDAAGKALHAVNNRLVRVETEVARLDSSIDAVLNFGGASRKSGANIARFN